jgi:hypothetical protein
MATASLTVTRLGLMATAMMALIMTVTARMTGMMLLGLFL